MARCKQHMRYNQPKKKKSGTINELAGVYINQTTVRRPKKFHPGTVALRDIRRLQKRTDELIPKIRFERLVREITQDLFIDPLRYTKDALQALQIAAEAKLIDVMERSYFLALGQGLVTLMPRHIRLLQATEH